jgi:hypothetical protein
LASSATKPSKPAADAPATGFRGDLRRVLYLGFKYELGCPGEDACGLYERTQEAACVTCPKHLKPVERDPQVASLARIRFITRMEALIGAGMKLDADDLPLNVWEALAVLKSERNRFERILMDARSANREQDRAVSKAQTDARKMDNIPAPGQSIFKATRK